MSIMNQSSAAITISVSGQNCMYDNGDDGSNLSLFNGVTIPPLAAFPTGGGTVYIESKASGTCAFENSEFTLGIGSLTTLSFTDISSSWSVSNSPNTVNVAISNANSQATILVTVCNPPA